LSMLLDRDENSDIRAIKAKLFHES
jgi:hypothetical protein